MRKQTKLILAILLILSSSLFRTNVLAGTNERHVIITRAGENVPGLPKAPSSIRVECWIDDEEETIWLGLGNAGNSVEVTISSNGATNDNVYSLSGDALSAIPLPETTGVWTITIALENGDVYYGQFVI